jgi:hypothetical protein
VVFVVRSLKGIGENKRWNCVGKKLEVGGIREVDWVEFD